MFLEFFGMISKSSFLKKGFRGALSGYSYYLGGLNIEQDQWLYGALFLVLGTVFIYWALLRPDKPLSCSFCGKRLKKKKVKVKWIPGTRVRICSDCMDRVRTVLAATHKTASTPIATIQYVSDDNREVRCTFCARHRYQVDAMAAAVRLGTSVKRGAGRAGREARICNRCLGRFESRREQRTGWLKERFQTAADQLDSGKPALRGVYAMAGVADDWEENRQTCVDALCAYLRMPYDLYPGQGAPEPQRLALQVQATREVRHAVIRVITAHLKEDAAVSWQGLNFDFTGVVFDGGDFRSARFSGGTVNFDGARFSDGTVSFDGARFSGGTVRFDGAWFSGGTVSFDGARFSGGTVSFDGARFSGGIVDFRRAKFSGGEVDFSGASVWSYPPEMPEMPWTDTPPSGVKLPRRKINPRHRPAA